jgi:hypothetical protein
VVVPWSACLVMNYMMLDGRWRKALSTTFTKENITHEKQNKKITYENKQKYMSKTKK